MSDHIPIDNVNICILGCVSAGKSTILNAMFCQDFSESKIKRTTMMPTAFVETRNAKISQSQPVISQHISDINKQIIEMTEKGQALNLAQFGNHMIFNVDKLDIKISKDFNVSIFDIPGLNDARTKEQYFNYLRNNFYLFNIVIFVVNIESGLNTSDEMDILNLIAEHISAQSKLEKNIKMLTIANKADEMQLNEKNGFPEIVSEELKEMYNQINLTISYVFKKKHIESHLIGTVPICGVDAHLFRMVKSLGSKYNLTPSQIQRIGTSEMGTRFRSKTPQEQKNIVNKVLSDQSFIDEMIKLSGFERIDQLLSECMKNSASSMALSNIYQHLVNLPTVSIYSIIETLTPILTTYAKIQRIDNNDYHKKMQELVKLIHSQLLDEINKHTDIIVIINIYDELYNKIANKSNIIDIGSPNGWGESISIFVTGKTSTITFKSMMEPFHNFEKFPHYLIERILHLVCNEFNNNRIPVKKLEYFLNIEQVSVLSNEVVELILDKILTNPNNVNTFIFDESINVDTLFDESINFDIFNVFEKIKGASNFIKFLRFLIRNKIHSTSSNCTENLMRLMLYKRWGEIPIQEYLMLKLSRETDLLANYGHLFDDGLSENSQSNLQFDDYYIKIATELQPHQFQFRFNF